MDPRVKPGGDACEFASAESIRSDHALVLLHHKSPRGVFLTIGAAQQGPRGKVATSATMRYRRMVETEFGMWRSGRKGGASGSVTVGNGKLREERGGARS